MSEIKFKHLVCPWYTSYFALFSIRERPNLTKLKNFMIFLDLRQFFRIWQDSVIIEMKVARNDVMNSFKLCNELSKSSIHSFHFESLWSSQNSDILQKKIVFWVIFRGSSREYRGSSGVGNAIKVILSNLKELCEI